jgi:DNA-binding XRE family transcriptional regulator
LGALRQIVSHYFYVGCDARLGVLRVVRVLKPLVDQHMMAFDARPQALDGFTAPSVRAVGADGLGRFVAIFLVVGAEGDEESFGGGMTQREAAAAVGTGASTLSKIESGRISGRSKAARRYASWVNDGMPVDSEEPAA